MKMPIEKLMKNLVLGQNLLVYARAGDRTTYHVRYLTSWAMCAIDAMPKNTNARMQSTVLGV